MWTIRWHGVHIHGYIINPACAFRYYGKYYRCNTLLGAKRQIMKLKRKYKIKGGA